MLQPSDIRTRVFKKGLFGYKPTDVDAFKDEVQRAYEETFNENNDMKEKLSKLNTAVEENRLKLFDLEKKLKAAEEELAEKKEELKAAKAAKNGTAAPKFKPQPKAEAPKAEEAPKATGSSKFFNKKAEEPAKPTAAASSDDDDEEIFTGEIEERAKPERMMIGDGEEDGDDDFEFM
ncbi:MAG: DivIVA domain-containing protein [Lachnospiraceae bacterium]|nr:DivIVA domain-containing protein [Lachnospiraceae bacterium]